MGRDAFGIRAVRIVDVEGGLADAGDGKDFRKDVFRHGAAPGGQGRQQPPAGGGVRLPREADEAVEGQEQVQGGAGGVEGVHLAEGGKDQGGGVVQGAGEDRQELVIRHGLGKLRFRAEDGPVGFAEGGKPVFIGGHMQAGIVDIGREIGHGNLLRNRQCRRYLRCRPPSAPGRKR